MRPYGKSNSISTGFSLADSGPLLKIGHNPLPNDLHGLSTNDCYHCYVWVISLFAKMHYVFFASRNSPLLQNIFPGAGGEN
jgi:hypothetical protein